MQKKGPPPCWPAQRSKTPSFSLALGACFVIKSFLPAEAKQSKPQVSSRRMLAANSCGGLCPRSSMLSLPVCSHFWSHLDCK